MKGHLTRPNLCPHCGYFHDTAATIGKDAIPKPGDLSICLNCGEPGIFTPSMTVRKLSALDGPIDPEAQNKIDLARTYCRLRGPIQRKEQPS